MTPTKINWANVVERALWTAVQSFLSVISIEAILGDPANAGKAGLIAAGATLLSTLKTIAQDRLAELRS